MASYRLTDNEVKGILQQADMYIEVNSNYRSLVPIRQCPWAKTNEWYTLTRFEVPRGSEDGSDFVEVGTTRTSATANQISYTYRFILPYGDVEMARNQGIPIWSDTLAVATKTMDYNITHLIFEGSHSWDEVAINGLRDGGTECANDATVWNTATNPITHVIAGRTALNTAGFLGPYSMVLSTNLELGFIKLYGTGFKESHEQLARENYGINQIAYLPIGTSTRTRVYPIAPADNDDGAWFMYKKDPSVFRLAEVGPPTTYINPELQQDIYGYEGYMRWRGTMEIVQATGVQYDPDVDLA